MDKQDYKAMNEELKPQLKQTAVEWLQDKLNYVQPTQFCSIETIKEWVEQAKQMEKEQIEDAWLSAWNIIMKPTNNESQTNL